MYQSFVAGILNTAIELWLKNDLHQPLEQHRNALRKGRQALPLAAASTTLRGNILLVPHILICEVTIDTRLTWSPPINRVTKTAQRWVVVCTLLNKERPINLKRYSVV